MKIWTPLLGAVAIGLALTAPSLVRGADDAKGSRTIDLADGKIVLAAPDSWLRKKPKVNFIDHEFAVPASKPDSEEGRVTVMGAGGTVDANIDRWVNQFTQPDGSRTQNQIPEKERKKTIAGFDVYLVDLGGTYKDMPRPFAPDGGGSVDRAGYRMLAAVIMAPKLGNYFIKFYGPSKTVADHAAEFWAMIDKLQKK